MFKFFFKRHAAVNANVLEGVDNLMGQLAGVAILRHVDCASVAIVALYPGPGFRHSRVRFKFPKANGVADVV